MEARAMSRFVRHAPRKLRRQADTVRGMRLEDAQAVLFLSRSPAARVLRRVVDSAAANAENNHEMDPEDLRIAQITVDESRRVPTRVRARARGRRERRLRRMSHITVVLTDETDADER